MINMLASNFTIKNGDLFRKSPNDDLLLRCLGEDEAKLVMAEVHEGICGAHQAGIKMVVIDEDGRCIAACFCPSFVSCIFSTNHGSGDLQDGSFDCDSPRLG